MLSGKLILSEWNTGTGSLRESFDIVITESSDKVIRSTPIRAYLRYFINDIEMTEADAAMTEKDGVFNSKAAGRI